MRLLRIAWLCLSLIACLPRGTLAQDMDVKQFIAQSVEGLRVQTSAHSATWRLGQEENWSVDQDSGTISFRFADGTVATAPIQIVGTYNPNDGTFLWGWDHPSVAEPLRAHTRGWCASSARSTESPP